MNMAKPERSITDIIGRLIDQVTSLIRNESALARAEISEKVSGIVGNIATLLIGVALIFPGLVILLEAAVAAVIRAGISEPFASLLVGGGIVLIGIICISIGINRLKSLSLVPKQTIKQIQLDVAAIQDVGKNP